MKTTTLFLFFFLTTAVQAADIASIAGLYYPASDEGKLKWSCTRDTVGMDGGALLISETEFHGVENRCDIEAPSYSNDSVHATLVCMSEGMPWQSSISITPTSNGVILADEHGDISWTRCAR